jgi:hypothetical protein
MAKKKPAKPVPLDWLEEGKVVGADAPLDWLTAPKVTIGQDENLATIPRRYDDVTGVLRPGDTLASKREQNARKREQKAASEPAPTPQTDKLLKGLHEKVDALAAKPAPPKKQGRRSKPWQPDKRERAILAIPRAVPLQAYCRLMAENKWPLLEGWSWPSGPKTFLEAYESRDERKVRLLNAITSERKNVWNRHEKRLSRLN